jgi:hypothetical protein
MPPEEQPKAAIELDEVVKEFGSESLGSDATNGVRFTQLERQRLRRIR